MNEELKIIIKAVTDQATKALGEVKKELKGIEEQSEKTKPAVDKALAAYKKGAVAAAAAISAVTIALVKLSKASDEFTRAAQKTETAFTTMGGGARQAEKTFKELYRFLGDNDRTAEAAQSLALITQNEKDLTEWTTILQGAFALMGDKLPTEALAEAANETIKVGTVTGAMADALNWLGVSEDAFNQRLATTNSLSEREAIVRSTLLGLYGGAAALYEANSANTLKLNESQLRLNQAMSSTSKYILPLRAELNNLSAVILTVLAPAIELVSVYLTAFIQVIVSAIEWVGTFFGVLSSAGEKTKANYSGYREAMSKYLNSIRTNLDASTNAGKDYEEQLKAIKKQAMGFDELNILTSTSAGSGNATGGSNGTTGDTDAPKMPKPEDFNIGTEQTDELAKKIENARKSLQIMLPIVAAIGLAISGFKLLNFINELKSANNIAKALEQSWEVIQKGVRTNPRGHFTDIFGKDPDMAIAEAKKPLAEFEKSLQRVGGALLVVAGALTLFSGVKDLVADGYSMEAVLKVLAGTIMTVVGVILIFNASLLASPITWIILGIAAVVAAFVILWNECEGFRNFWINLWEGIKKVWASFVESIQPFIDAMVKVFKEGWELVKVIFTLAWDAIKFVWSQVSPFFIMLWENLKGIFSFVIDIWVAQFKLAWEYIKAVWDMVVAYFTAIWESIAIIFSVVKNVLSGNWKEAWEAIKSIVDPWKKYFQTVWESIKKIFSAVGNYFGSVFGTAVDFIKQRLNSLVTFFTSILDRTKAVFKKIGSSIIDAVSGAFTTAFNWVLKSAVDLINNFIGIINFNIGIINAIPGVNITKIAKLEVPQLATGGIVSSATMAMVGERGKEAVLPLENNTGWMDMLAERINGNQPSKIVLQLDGKALGEATIGSINNITRQTGKLQLTLV